MKPIPVPLKNVTIEGGFWGPRVRLASEVIVPYQWKVMNDRIPGAEKSHAIKNLRIAAGRSKGEFQGARFSDSDVGKWLEALAYGLATHPDKKLEKIADGVIDLLAEAQETNGYLDTFYIIKEKEKQLTNLRDQHELYVMGHLMEGAVAYYEATGKRKYLEVMMRAADLMAKLYGPKRGQKRAYPGHQEVEIALVKLYRVTGDKKYLNLSKFFIDERGREPYYFDLEAKKRSDGPSPWDRGDRSHRQAHMPVREQKEAVGHAVRAMYMYSAMVDVARETHDKGLMKACVRLWKNVTERRMYVTGGVGSSHSGESFTVDYDLPNETGYAETCASVGMVFWAHRMVNYDPDNRYADVMERALYNGVMSGVSLDGEHYFYVNPMAAYPKALSGHNSTARRFRWHGCACCPPNLARLLTSLGGYIYSQTPKEAFVHLYVNGKADVKIGGQNVVLTQKTEYPWSEKVRITVSPENPAEFTVSVRIPGWCRNAALKVNGKKVQLSSITRKGYARIDREWAKGDKIDLLFPMPVERLRSHPKVRANVGRTALQRGPVVYCLEEADNGPDLNGIALPSGSKLAVKMEKRLLGGVPVITGRAIREDARSSGNELYGTGGTKTKSTTIKAIPYSLWANRREGEMLVWIRTT